MELTEGVYEIPESLRAIVNKGGRTVTIKKKTGVNKIAEGDYRCKDCIFWTKGRTYLAKKHSHFQTFVCSQLPKNVEKTVFYHKNYCDKPCEKFKLKTQ